MKIMLKRTISIVLSTILVLTVCFSVPVSISAVTATSGTTGDCTWTLDEDGTFTVSGNGKMADYFSRIPWKKSDITSIIIEDGVTSIGNYAFSSCDNIREVYIPDSVTSIGICSFAFCNNLTSVRIPNHLTRLGAHAFDACQQLLEITIPETVTRIEEGTFYNCVGITEFKIHPTVTAIDRAAFQGCTGITEISIPDSVVEMDDSVFSGCTNLRTVKLPDQLTNIRYYLFGDCTSLDNVVIPDSVRTIEDSAFKGCTSLSHITFSKNLYDAGVQTFDGTPWLEQQSGLVFTGPTVYLYKGNDEKVIIPEGTTAITKQAFQFCKNMKEVVIPDSVTYIGESAFWQCTSLKELTIPESVTEVSNFLVWGCTSLTNIHLHNGITRIGMEVFENCDKLTEITVPDSVRIIDDLAFYHCPNVTAVHIPEGVNEIKYRSFEGCTGLTEMTLPDSVVSIGEAAFSSCTNLTKITIPDSITSIYDDAFSGCENLTIYGYPDSYAQTFANDKGIPFTEIYYGECPNCHANLTNRLKVASTCKQQGHQVSVCNNCSTEVRSDLPLAEHIVEKDDMVPATCTATGLTEGSHCSVCGEILEAQEIIPALTHHYITVEGYSATDTHTGLTDGLRCSRCGIWGVEQQIIPVVEPTEPEPTEVPPTEAPTNSVSEDGGSYYVVGSMNGWEPNDMYRLSKNGNVQGEYVIKNLIIYAGNSFKIKFAEYDANNPNTGWYPDGMGNDYNITESGSYNIYFRPDGNGGSDWWGGTYGKFFYVEGPFAIPATESPEPTEAPTEMIEPTEIPTDAPTETIEPTEMPTEAPTESTINGNTYYLTGSIAGWSLNVDFVLTSTNNSDAEEYRITGIMLTTNDMVKAVKSSKNGDSISEWYPDGLDNNISVERDSTYTILFRPNGDGSADDGWIYSWYAGEQPTGGAVNRGGYMFKIIDENPLVTEPPTEAPEPTEPEPTIPPETEAPTEPMPEPILGDVDGDGVVSVMDATRIQRYLAYLCSLDGGVYRKASNEDERYQYCDVDGDGRISIFDALRIQRYIAKMCNLDGSSYVE